MKELWQTMLSPTRIVSTVFVGIILNLASGYLKDGENKILATLSERAALKIHAQRRGTEELNHAITC